MGAGVDLTQSLASAENAVEVLIVGAGPTGLTLGAPLKSFGVPFRIVDRSATAAHESRALAVQARTLEILQSLGLGEALVTRGKLDKARTRMHGDIGPTLRKLAR